MRIYGTRVPALAWLMVLQTLFLTIGCTADDTIDLAVPLRQSSAPLIEKFETVAQWVSDDSLRTTDVAFGDVDGDGDLDFATSEYNVANHLYENIDGSISTSAGWISADTDSSMSVEFGDADADGDVDLVVAAANKPTRIYNNIGTSLNPAATWLSSHVEAT